MANLIVKVDGASEQYLFIYEYCVSKGFTYFAFDIATELIEVATQKFEAIQCVGYVECNKEFLKNYPYCISFSLYFESKTFRNKFLVYLIEKVRTLNM